MSKKGSRQLDAWRRESGVLTRSSRRYADVSQMREFAKGL